MSPIAGLKVGTVQKTERRPGIQPRETKQVFLSLFKVPEPFPFGVTYCLSLVWSAPNPFQVSLFTLDGRNPAPPKKPRNENSPANSDQQGFQPWCQSGAKWISSVRGIIGYPPSLRLSRACQGQRHKSEASRHLETRPGRRAAQPHPKAHSKRLGSSQFESLALDQ